MISRMGKKTFKIGLYCVLIIAGYLLHRSEIINDLYIGYIRSEKSETYIKHVKSAKSSNPKTIHIVLPEKNLIKLYEQRRLALEVGQYYKDDPRFTGYLQGILIDGQDSLQIKLRLKGLFQDHFEDSLKCSYKIKLKGDNTFMGMDRFAVQHPKTRGYMNEWYLHQLLNYSGLISIRYDFIEVIINGRNAGIYAVEENIHKNLIENNQLKEGPVFRFEVEGEGPIFYHKIKPYNGKRLKGDSILLLQYQYAKNMMYEFRNEAKSTSDIFDVEKMAKFFAIIDLTGHHHASHVFNLKFYYNPVTSLIEPLGYDNSSFIPLDSEGLLGTLKIVGGQIKNRGEILWKNEPFSERLFNDPIFFEAYMKYLQEFSKTEWLDSFFELNYREAQEKLNIIWRSYPEYNFVEKDVLYQNQEWIKNYLQKYKSPIIKKGTIYTNGDIQFLKLRNPNQLPVQLVSVKVLDNLTPVYNVLLQPYFENENPIYVSIPIKCKVKDSAEIVLTYKYFGTNNEQNSTYLCKVREEKKQQIEQIPALNRFSDLKDIEAFEIAGDTIKIAKGNYTFSKDLIIEPGYLVWIEPGSKINLAQGAKFISKSPVIASGTALDSILFHSLDKSGQGLFVLNTNETSLFKFCQFKHLSNVHDRAWKLSGAVNFYKAEVRFEDCKFTENLKGDDALNVMNTEFKVSNCLFERINSDGLDCDFANGEVSNCLFNIIGNDALDFSGSNVLIKDCKINNAQDKALSAGENSVIEIHNVEIDQCEIGLTSKDNSKIIGDNIKITNSKIALCSFQKKAQFGPASIELKNSKIMATEINFLIEIGSHLLMDGEVIEGNQIDIESVFYGNIYGKNTLK